MYQEIYALSVRVDGLYLSLIKFIEDKQALNIILSGQKLNFYSNISNKTRMPTITTSIYFWKHYLEQGNKKRYKE